MEIDPRKRALIDVQRVEEAEPILSPEEHIAGVLDFLSGMRNAWVRIDYTLLGDRQQMTTETLKREPTDTDADRMLFLLQKAHELQCAEDVQIKIINPDRPDKEIDVKPF